MQTITKEQLFARFSDQYSSTVENYDVIDDHVLIDSIRKPLKNCKFKNLSIQNPINVLTLENCVANTLVINGSNAYRMQIFNCKILSLEIINSSSTVVEISGTESQFQLITFKGQFGSVILGHINDLTQINFQSTKMDSVKVDSVSNALIKFNNVGISKSSNFLSNKKNHLEFFETDVANMGVLTPTDLKIDFISTKAETITLNDGTYDVITFQSTGHFDFQFSYPSFKRTEARVKTIELSNFYLADKSRIKLLDVRIEKLIASDFENNGVFSFNNCTITNRFDVSASNLGKMLFTNTSISDNADVSLINSNVMDATFSNMKWRKDYNIFQSRNENLLAAIRETYRQLKANYLRNGNKIEALEFQKHELRAHYEFLKLKKYTKPVFKNLGNYLIVATNKWSSDFGQNIWKPLVLLFIFHLLLFNFLLCNTPDLGVKIGASFDPDLISKGFKIYFQTLLPIHGTEIKIENTRSVSIAGFWDFMTRVSSGYFIYYFISASRKYHQ